MQLPSILKEDCIRTAITKIESRIGVTIFDQSNFFLDIESNECVNKRIMYTLILIKIKC